MMIGRRTIRWKDVHDQRGLTFVETLVTTLLSAIAILGLVVLFSDSVKQNAVAADITVATSLAQDKMEELKNMDYGTLTAGGDAGSATTMVSGYADHPDPYYTRLWEIDVNAPAAHMTTITVRVVSSRHLFGAPKACELNLTRSR
jgi:type IV pilus assembly protein PilV